MEVEVVDDEVRSSMPLSRKRGPRGPGRRGRKSRRENSQGQDSRPAGEGGAVAVLLTWNGKQPT